MGRDSPPGSAFLGDFDGAMKFAAWWGRSSTYGLAFVMALVHHGIHESLAGRAMQRHPDICDDLCR
jgi:hypothetical protein